jgi:membrane protease YdiL (CAAX protease family)
MGTEFHIKIENNAYFWPMIQKFQYFKPSLGQSWLLVALVIVGSIVAAFVMPNAPHSLGYFVMMMIPVAFCWWQGANAQFAGERPLPINAPHFGKMHPILFFLIAGIALLTLSVVIEPTTSFIPMPDSIKRIFEDAFMDSPLWDAILATCILAPVLEEFLCRGMMLRGMLPQKGARKAILWSAFLFAFMHLNPWQSIPAFLIGIFMGWVYWQTHCLWATIFLHFLNNATSIVISRIWTDLPVDAAWKDILPPAQYWVMYAGCVIVAAISLYFLYEKTLPAKVSSPVDA